MPTPTNPMSDFIDKYKTLPGKVLDTVEHPVDAVERWLGELPPPQAQPLTPTQDTSWHDQMVRQANQSFQTQAAADEAERQKKQAIRQRFLDLSANRPALATGAVPNQPRK